MSDSRNPNDPQWADAGWLQMQELLDQEMPVERRRRLAIWWWWAAAGVVLLLLTAWWLHGSAWSTDFGPANTVAQGPAADLPERIEADVQRLTAVFDQYQAKQATQKTKSTKGTNPRQLITASQTAFSGNDLSSFASSMEAAANTVNAAETNTTTLEPKTEEKEPMLDPFGPALGPVATLATNTVAFAQDAPEQIVTPAPTAKRWHWTGSVLGFAGTHQQSGLGLQTMLGRDLGAAQKWSLAAGLSYRQNINGDFFDDVDFALASADEEAAPIMNQDSMPVFNNSGEVVSPNAPRFREFSLPIAVRYQVHPRWQLGLGLRPAVARTTYEGTTIPEGQAFNLDQALRFSPVNQYGQVQQTVWDIWYGAGVQFKLSRNWQLDLQWQASARSWQLPEESKLRQTVQLGVAYRIR